MYPFVRFSGAYCGKLIMGLMSKSFISVVLLSLSINMLGQSLLKDTIQVQEVEVTASRVNFYQEDFKTIKADSTLKDMLGHVDVQEVLQCMAPVQIMTYGSAGALSGIKLRGGGSSHTQVNWNGFPANSLTAGSADLSMFNLSMGDEITLVYGGAGSLYGSGAVDGVINIESTPEFTEATRVSTLCEGGSFNHYLIQSKVEKSNEKVHFSAAVYNLDAKNDFPFYDTRGRKRTNAHNAVRSLGLAPYFHYKTRNAGTFGFGIMYHGKVKEIPVKMNSIPGSIGTQVQRDSTFKGFVRWDYVGQGYSVQVKSALFNDYLKYVEKGADDSNISSQRFYNDVNVRLFPGTSFSFDVGAQYSILKGEATTYKNGAITENDGAFIVAGKYRKNNLVVNASGRLAFNSHYNIVPVGAVGGRYRILKDWLTIRMQLATRYRQPTFNDRYWEPYGNPELDPEKGYNAELGVTGRKYLGSHLLSYDITGYHSFINDWIQWVPSDKPGGMEPVNYTSVQSRGLELMVSDVKTYSWGVLKLQGQYNYNRTINDNKQSSNYGKLMVYMPRHKGSLGLMGALHNKIWIMVNGNVVGDRFTTENNSSFEKLDPYYTINTKLKYKQAIKSFLSIGAYIKAENILDCHYQVYKLYQMPGRAFYFGLEISFNS